MTVAIYHAIFVVTFPFPAKLFALVTKLVRPFIAHRSVNTGTAVQKSMHRGIACAIAHSPLE